MTIATCRADQVGAASALLAAAAAWPAVLCLMTQALASPYERALRVSWCGAHALAGPLPQHCPACWAGTALLAMLAAGTLASRPAARRIRA